MIRVDRPEELFGKKLKEEKCPHCGKIMKEHISCDGARFHVTSYIGKWDGSATTECSEKDCEMNHGIGKCVPDTHENCNICGGKGKITRTISTVCPYCNGEGRTPIINK